MGSQVSEETCKEGKVYRLLTLISILLFVCIILLEPLALNSSPARYTGMLLWIASYSPILVYTLLKLRQLFNRSEITKNAVAVSLVLVFMGWLIYSVPNGNFFSSEAALQVMCGAEKISQAPDGGFRDECFLRYPTRAYYFVSLPTVLFPRSLTTLAIGFALILWAGVIVFLHGLRTYLSKNFDAASTNIYVFLASVLCLNITLVKSALGTYEQVQFLFSYGLMATGLLLDFIAEKRLSTLAVALLVLMHCTFSYTPMLLLLPPGLLLFALIVKNFSKLSLSKAHRSLALLAVSGLFFEFIMGIHWGMLKKATSFVGSPNMPLHWSELLSLLFSPDREVLTTYRRMTIFSVFSHFLFVGSWLLSLSGLMGINMLIVAVWILIGGIFSVMGGHAEFNLATSLFRIGVCLPLMALITLNVIDKVSFTNISKRSGLLFLSILLSASAITGFFPRETQPIDIRLQSILWLREKMDSTIVKLPLKVWIDPAITSDIREYISIADVGRYFLPLATFEGGCGERSQPGAAAILISKARSRSQCATPQSNMGKVIGTIETNDRSFEVRSL